ncbi:MAG: 50S ribosomal protein L6 [Bacteroidetes bacterium]|nr:50S ribosomal protein L6 [Bacteroidota bacterium]MCZ2132889.1 50S ribosomal protein L6 [Bacteroidota bacterium]
MSRIGKRPINIPSGVQLTMAEGVITAKGPKGELCVQIPEPITCNYQNNVLEFQRPNDEKKVRALHGLARALTANAVQGVTNGFQRNLIIEGVGYRAELRGQKLALMLGFSHQVLLIPPQGVEFAVPVPTQIHVKGIDKKIVGEIAAKIRSLRPPEPYKGKGVRYEGEQIRRKAGKSAGK